MKTPPRNSPKRLRVVPLVSIAPEKSPFFSYQSDQDIPRGSVVSISFGPRTVRGIVWGEEDTQAPSSHSAPRKPFRYKDIGNIIAKSFLPESALLMAEHFSRIHTVPLGTCLLKFLPKAFPKESSTSLPSKHSTALSPPWKKCSFQKKTSSLTKEQRRAAKNILTSSRPNTLLFASSTSDTAPVYVECIKKLLANKGQTLILLPDSALIMQEESRYANFFGREAIGVFQPRMKSAERDELIHRLRKGMIRVLIGTRSALLLPFRELALIIVGSAHAKSYKRSGVTTPDSACHTATLLASLHQARCLFESSAPSFDTLLSARQAQALVTLSEATPSTSWHTINLRLERWKKKRSPLSEEFGNALAATIARNKQALLFVAREGMNSFSVCTECKAVFRCATCKKPLIYRSEGDYQCRSCKKSAGTTPSCPACGSLSFHHLGAGTERVERELARRFPRIRTVRYDRNNALKKETTERLRQFIAGERDVLITSERGIHGWDLPRLSLIGIIDADTLLGIPAWNADEIAFQSMLSVGGRARGEIDGETPGSVFIQTFHPENPIFAFLAAEDIEGFFQTLEEERHLFLYPPFGTITQLTCRMTNEKKLDQEVDRVYEKLQTFSKQSPRTFRMSPPAITRRDTSQKRLFRKSIALRISTSTKDPQAHQPELEHFLQTLPREWNREESTDTLF